MWSPIVGLWLLYAAQLAAANCNHDNCLRAVIASAFTTRSGSADCASYFLTTVVTSPGVQTAQTITPSNIPAYASACSGSVRYSSACSCLGVTHIITTVAAATPTPPGGYVIVSPSSCPLSAPTGTIIGQSDATFPAANGGLQYQQYPNSQFIIQNATSGPFFVDLSSSSSVSISDTDGNTLIIYANGTFEAFAGSCEIEIVGSGLAVSSSSKWRRSALERRQSLDFCNDIKSFCSSTIGHIIIHLAFGAICKTIGAEIGADIGGGIGFLGNIFGPEVGIPATIVGIILGMKFGAEICTVATTLLADQLCEACPSSGSCGFGTLSCNGGPCQDVLSDPNNCGACGNTCPDGICRNGQCSASTCDGSTCSNLNSCGSDCSCFETSSDTGFCGPHILCAPLPDCASSSDCSEGEVCATGTCCERNVCLGPCSIIARRSFLFGRDPTDMYTGGQGPA